MVNTHPIQYHAPWFRALASRPEIDFKVLYCHQATPQDQASAGFGVAFQWDVSLLDGYAYEFLPNASPKPAVDFWGLHNPDLPRRIAAGEFDAVVVDGWHYRSAWQAMQACRRSETPVFARGDSHMHSPRHPVKVGAKWPFYRWFIPRLDACLPVGTWSREYFLHYGADPRRIFEVPHTIDSERISKQAADSMSQRDEIRRRWGFADEDVVVAFSGKLIPKKRPLDFIRAIRKARDSGARVAGLIVGDGPLRGECELEVRNSGAPVQFAGFLNQTQIIDAYVAADALALPSDGFETWGLVVNEAMVCGRACFLSDQVGSSPDLIDDGKTGAIFRCGDVEQFAAVLKKYADRSTLNDMGESARQKIRDYTPEAAAGRLIEAVLSCFETCKHHAA